MSFETYDLVTIGLLIFLEGVLSVDNAVVLALLARQLPENQRKRALTYGIAGAIVFRLLALAFVSHLMKWVWVKFVGGGYLLYVAITHWLKKGGDEQNVTSLKGLKFWRVVLVIELTDIAFAIDSILAAVAVSPKLWVVVTGGVLGLIMMRFAATLFIRLLDKFPAFEDSAYLLVALVGAKLFIDGFKFPGVDFHSSSSPAFWAFWLLLALFVGLGFRKSKKSKMAKPLEDN